jgi:cell division protein FtsB
MTVWELIYKIGWIALTVLVIIAIVSMFLPMIRSYQELHRKEALLQEDIKLEEAILKHLKDQQERLQTDPRFVEKIAREEFGYVKPGETVFKFVDEDTTTNRPRK